MVPDDVLLTDRSVLVTGAAQGIGRATALMAARFGADVAVCDRNGGALSEAVTVLEATGRTVVSATLDVRERAAVSEFVEDVGGRLGGVDVLVNNAGGTFYCDFEALSEKGERTLVDENFTSAGSVIRAVLPFMPDGGSIVNITSIEASRASPGIGVYAAMKAALESLTQTLALELSHRRIRVNNVAPDSIVTPGGEQVATENPGAFTLPGLSEEQLTPAAPLPYLGSADDVAAAVLFLAGRMSSFITGTTVRVDGGNHAAGGWYRRDLG